MSWVIPVADESAAVGSLVTAPGCLQFGRMLLGVGSAAGLVRLTGWRSLAGVDVADTPRPQAHGSYPGDAYAAPAVVTFEFLLRGSPGEKAMALDVLEQHTRVQSTELPLIFNDGSGPWRRMARVIARDIPVEKHFTHAPVEGSVQWLCADPRRYSLAENALTIGMPSSAGGLTYPLTYPLDYGTVTSGSGVVVNSGSEATPVRLTLQGPLTAPAFRAGDMLLRFNTTLAASEQLVVDTDLGTVLLGDADRVATISNDSTPVELFQLEPGATDIYLTAEAGSGTATLAFNDARM